MDLLSDLQTVRTGFKTTEACTVIQIACPFTTVLIRCSETLFLWTVASRSLLQSQHLLYRTS